MIKIKHVLSTILLAIISMAYGQVVEFKDQSITITNADIKKNEIRAGVQGVQLTCYAVFKYGEANIKGAEESDYLKQYYFFLEIKKGDNADRIFYPLRNPDEENKETTALQAQNLLNLRVSTRTVQNYLRRLGWRRIVTRFCQFVSSKNRSS